MERLTYTADDRGCSEANGASAEEQFFCNCQRRHFKTEGVPIIIIIIYDTINVQEPHLLFAKNDKKIIQENTASFSSEPKHTWQSKKKHLFV